MTSRLTDERIAEIEALWANDRRTVMDHIPDLLAEVKELRAEKAQAESERDVLARVHDIVLLVYQIRQTINNINVLRPTTGR